MTTTTDGPENDSPPEGMERSRIDPTYRAWCSTHGPSSAQTYLGRERYGCLHCNPYRPIKR